MSFWNELPLPIIGLSPMDGVTDHPFRHITKKYGHPDVMYTEFTSTEGVCHGADKLLEDFLYDETQRPIAAQIYGTTPDFFRQTAVILCELGFDGIDINMGCPAKNVAHSGAGAALITTPHLALEIIRQTKAGVADYFSGKRARDCKNIKESIWREVEHRYNQLPDNYQNRHQNVIKDPLDHVPISVKTRIGYSDIIASEWVSILMEEHPAAIAMHGRTLKQQYSGEANWEAIAQGAAVTKNTDTFYLGNGDVKTKDQALAKIKTYAIDGVLIGRGAFGDPYCFHQNHGQQDDEPLHYPNRFQLALEHAGLYQNTLKSNDRYNFLPMRKHLGWYVKSIPYATEIRQELFRTENVDDVEQVLQKYHLFDQ